jgi:hypothetical protein
LTRNRLDQKHERPTKCLRNGGVTCKFKVLSSFNVWFRGQDAASKAHHCANTNVVGKLARQLRQLMTDQQINELADNLDSGLRCFVHKDKKAIVTTPDTINNPDSDSEWWDEANEEIENNFDSYVEIHKMDSHESFRLMENFIETVDNVPLRDRLQEALRRPKPFANFKFDIDQSGIYRQKWFDFKKRQMIEWVRGQVIVNDL